MCFDFGKKYLICSFRNRPQLQLAHFLLTCGGHRQAFSVLKWLRHLNLIAFTVRKTTYSSVASTSTKGKQLMRARESLLHVQERSMFADSALPLLPFSMPHWNHTGALVLSLSLCLFSLLRTYSTRCVRRATRIHAACIYPIHSVYATYKI